jgi:hypothetical protein
MLSIDVHQSAPLDVDDDRTIFVSLWVTGSQEQSVSHRLTLREARELLHELEAVIVAAAAPDAS